MRACINTKCVAFGWIVYSVATRCPLCKWDLKFTYRPAKPHRRPSPLAISFQRGKRCPDLSL